jgi:hypothetical protein
MPITMDKAKLALHALTQHIFPHRVSFVLYSRLEKVISPYNSFVAAKDCVSSGHWAALT